MADHPEREQSVKVLEQAFDGIYSLENLKDEKTIELIEKAKQNPN